MVKKIVTMILALLILLPLLAGQVAVPASAAQTDLQATIDQQIRAYADSIDQPNADDDAARVIAMHGGMMGGRSMCADESDALTATLMNSNLLPKCLAETCTNLLALMRDMNRPDLYAIGSCQWYSSSNHYKIYGNSDNDDNFDEKLDKVAEFTGIIEYNDYDAAMDWIAGSAHINLAMVRSEATEDSVVYDVYLKVSDDFNFDHNQSGSVPSAFVGLLGSAMFREFPWESNVTFQLTVPNDCAHEEFTEAPVEPTCTTSGGIRHTCSACGYSYTEETTPAQGHTWGEYKSNNDATCQKDGTKTAVCTTCGETDTVTDPGTKIDHNWMAATCLYPKTCLDCGETRGETTDHNWLDATCTDPKTCSVCGLTEGKALGHTWTGVTCEHANTCEVCGLVVGEPRDHTWVAATCTKAKYCAFCGKTEGKPIGHDWTGGSCTTGPTCKNCGTRGTAPGHSYTGGSCTEAQVCTKCGAEGSLLGHAWTAADCHSARVCTVCGVADGQPLGHDWVAATCTESQSCARCGLTEGEPLGHDWLDATCTASKTCARCALTEGDPADHPWLDATCYEPKTCPTCGLTEGSPLDHAWADATCHNPKKCTLCSLTEGESLEHIWSEGDCTNPPTCELCAEERTAPGHAWLNADCDTPRTCAICNTVEGEALSHPDSDENGLCDRCGEKLNTVAIQPQPVFDWWPIAAIAVLVILGVIDFFVVREYRRTKAGYYE